MAGNGASPSSPVSLIRKILATIVVLAVVLMYIASFLKPEFKADPVTSLGMLAFATGLIAPELTKLGGNGKGSDK